MTHTWLALQTLTNLALVPPGPGLPRHWILARERHGDPPTFQITAGHALRIDANSQAGLATFGLAPPLAPQDQAALSWRWRTATPIPRAALRDPGRDDSPVRVLVTFDDGRVLAYVWANTEPVGDVYRQSPTARRGVVVCRRTEDANGSWYVEAHNPFADYRHLFNRAPHAIVAVGVAAETDHFHGHTVADVSDLSWD